MKKNIDIVHIYYGTQGASGLYIDEIYTSLKKSNINQEIFVSYYYPFKYGKRIFFKYTDLASGIKNSAARKYFRASELLIGLLRCILYIAYKKPKIVNYSLNASFFTDIILLKTIKFVSKAKVVVTCHDVIPFSRDQADKQKQMGYRKKIFAIADYLLVHNNNSITDLEQYYDIGTSKILHHSFPIMDLKKLNLKQKSTPKTYDFAFIGHLRHEKGIATLVDAWKIFHKKFPEARLLIAGNAPIKMDILAGLENMNVVLKLQFLNDFEYLNLIESASTILLPYIMGTNSGVVYNLVNLDVTIIYSDLDMFKTNTLLDKEGMFESKNVNQLVEKMSHFYKKEKTEENNVEKYRKQFDKEIFEAYNKVLLKQVNNQTNIKIQENNNYQICTKTIMDTTDSGITFNAKGESDYYTNFVEQILPDWNYGKDTNNYLKKIALKIKKERKNHDFDCIIGVSGGLDSSYLAYIAKEIMGLRPLLYHVDAGWNSSQAVSNIEKIINGLHLDLYTDVINWQEMKDLQRSFFKAQVPDIDAPQDIAFFSSLYKFAKKNKIKYILTGGNISTECCREPEQWGAYPGIDRKLIINIHKEFGGKPLKTFPIIDIFNYKIYFKYVLGIKVIQPLNYVPYIKQDAEKLLFEKYGWESFKHKHHESRFTRFFEDYWLPQKFGFDKRKAHLSSLILTNQLTREQALLRIQKPELDAITHQNEFEFVADKLDFTVQELTDIFNAPNKVLSSYNSNRKLIGYGITALQKLGIEKRLFR